VRGYAMVIHKERRAIRVRRMGREISMTAEQNDNIRARELAERLRKDPRPRCPPLRACRAERLYPVQGYCVLAESPGWFMIPSIEEYR